eukprot:6397438-Pyramimonas_sp.AAC.1
MSKEYRNSVGRVSPRTRQVKTSEFGTFLGRSKLFLVIKAKVGWNIINLEHNLVDPLLTGAILCLTCVPR